MPTLLLLLIGCAESTDDSGGAAPDGGASVDGGGADGGDTADGGGTDGGGTGPTSTFEARFDMVIDAVPYQDECLGSFPSLTLDPGGSPAVDGVIACTWQGALAEAFGLSTMGGLVDAEPDPKGGEGAVSGTWSLGPIQEPWTGTLDEVGALVGSFAGKGELSYGGAEVSYSFQGYLSASGDLR